MVIGGGDTAMEEAITLAHHAAKVIVVHRPRQLARQQDHARARNDPCQNQFFVGYHPRRLFGGQVLECVRLKKCTHRRERDQPIDGVFMAIGHHPNTEFLQGVLELDAKRLYRDPQQR